MRDKVNIGHAYFSLWGRWEGFLEILPFFQKKFELFFEKLFYFTYYYFTLKKITFLSLFVALSSLEMI